ncbi:MAG: hypothetical protein ACYS5V_17380, partial [Planctomycetota bacterium]
MGNRPDVRQAHRASELALIRWAEPWATVAWNLGREYPAFYLTRAWKMLLANQAHDSLNGGAMDRINHQTAVRNEKIQTLAGGVRRRSIEEIRGTTTPCGLAMQCDDSVEPHEAEVRIIDEANRVFG